jgi:cobalt-zinc-cadmium resistance protein CzcA
LWFVPNQARIRAAELNKQAIQSNYRNYQIGLRGQIQQAIQQYRRSKSSLNYYQTSALPNADLILKQSQASFRGGEIGYAEYLLGVRNAISIKDGYFQTLNEYNQSIIYIEFLTGIK